MSNVFFEQVPNADAQWISQDHLSDLLRRAGSFGREARAKEKCDECSNQEHKHPHNNMLRNGELRIAWRDVKRVKQGQSQRTQEMIDEHSDG